MNAGVSHRHSEALAPGAVIDAPGRTILASTPLSQSIQHMYDRATKMLVGALFSCVPTIGCVGGVQSVLLRSALDGQALVWLAG